MTQITQVSGIPKPNLRNLWNLWMSAPVPLHPAWPQRPLSDSAWPQCQGMIQFGNARSRRRARSAGGCRNKQKKVLIPRMGREGTTSVKHEFRSPNTD